MALGISRHSLRAPSPVTRLAWSSVPCHRGKLDLQSLLYPFSRALPNVWLFNYLIAAVFFFRANGRLPRKPRAINAELNDFIFHRMILDGWNALERRCVDKELAKDLALQSADVKIARTVAVFNLKRHVRPKELLDWLRPYLGKPLVAKPTHGSGPVLFLDREITYSQVHEFLIASKKKFFYAIRETQYEALPRKILIEENISKGGSIDDYKFFCVKGVVLYCQVDIDRFTNHRRAICTVPDFAVVPVRTKFLEIPQHLERPAHFDEMVQIASDLSRDFSFVRIDLYDTDDGVYFGEYTLSPGGASDNFSDVNFANEFLRQVRSVMRDNFPS
jgi:hypothetical protein